MPWSLLDAEPLALESPCPKNPKLSHSACPVTVYDRQRKQRKTQGLKPGQPKCPLKALDPPMATLASTHPDPPSTSSPTTGKRKRTDNKAPQTGTASDTIMNDLQDYDDFDAQTHRIRQTPTLTILDTSLALPPPTPISKQTNAGRNQPLPRPRGCLSPQPSSPER